MTLVGGAIGAVAGLLFFSLYAIAAAVICGGRPGCPSWLPYAIFSTIGLPVGAAGGLVLVAAARALFRWTRV